MRRTWVGILSFAALLGLYFGYAAIVRDPLETGDREPHDDALIPRADEIMPPERLKIGGTDIQIPAGGTASVRVFDPNTGQATRQFKYQEFKPVADTQNEIWVKRPEVTLRMPSGMVATVWADEGQVTVERIDSSRVGWKFGWLRGDTHITIDRPRPDAEAAAGPQRLIEITLDRMDFDMELGRMKSDGDVRAAGDEFEIEGTGLDFAWNVAANRVEELRIAQGRRLALLKTADVLGFSRQGEAATTQPGSRPSATTGPQRQDRRQRRETTYLCTLDGAVRAEQITADGSIASTLDCGGLKLLFDLGRGGELGSRSTSRPAAAERLEVRWHGPLTLLPDLTPQPAQKPTAPSRAPRRRLEALGPVVTLTRADTHLSCGRIEFYDESGQAWLYPGEDGRVTVKAGPGKSIVAGSIYVDRRANLVKLIGDVRLESRTSPKSDSMPRAVERTSSITCSQTAELTLEPGSSDETGIETGALEGFHTAIRSGTFSGDVEVHLSDQRLTGQRLDVGFRRAATRARETAPATPTQTGEPTFETLIESAVATGNVELLSGDDRVECGRLELAFSVGDDGASYPRHFDAHGSVHVTRLRSHVRGDRVAGDLAPLPAVVGPEHAAADDARDETRRTGPDRERLAIRYVEIEGRAELVDRERRVGARGERVLAWIAADNQVERAEVHGGPSGRAIVHASPYTVRGGKIDVNVGQRTLDVLGPSGITFSSRRGLSGEARETPTLVRVSAQRSLRIDAGGNTIRVEGDVVARSGGDRLRGSAMTLRLEDIPQPAPARTLRSSVSELYATLRPLWQGGAAEDRRDIAPQIGFGTERGTRKEPVRLIVENAYAQTRTYEPGVRDPIVDWSLDAPWMEVDIPRRLMQTSGNTTLLLTDYRLGHETGAARRDSGVVPSDLMSGGPSQTLITCDTTFSYQMGADGPARRDSALLEGSVFMVYRAGREIVNLEQTPVGLRYDRAALEKLKSRHSTLQCNRLEALFARPESGQTAAPDRTARGPATRLAWMNATTNVFLRDRQGTAVSEVSADQLQFDRPNGLVSVWGSKTADARIHRYDEAKGKFSTPAVGRELHLDVVRNTITTKDRVSGEIQP